MSFILLGILNSQAAGAPAGAGAYDLLETTVLGSDTASVSFTGLGSYTDYKHLQIRMVARSDASSSNKAVFSRFNSDSGSNYAWHYLNGNGSSVNSGNSTSQSQAISGLIAANTAAANDFGACVLDLLDFSDSSKNSTIRTLGGASSVPRIDLHSGLWINTNAVTTWELFPDSSSNFITGSRFSLYGIKAA